MKDVTWAGPKPTTCDICGAQLKKTFIDGKTSHGPWGIMCKSCHAFDGYGLGQGKGQEYDLETLKKIKG